MRVSFHTNLDVYRQVQWPVIDYKPNVGEMVEVADISKGYCKVNELPYQLEIVAVRHTEQGCRVELWYRKIDVQAAELSGKLSKIMGL